MTTKEVEAKIDEVTKAMVPLLIGTPHGIVEIIMEAVQKRLKAFCLLTWTDGSPESQTG